MCHASRGNLKEANWLVVSASLPQSCKSGWLSTSNAACSAQAVFWLPLLLLHTNIANLDINTALKFHLLTHLKTGYLSGLNENLLFLIRKRTVFHRGSLTLLSPDYVSPQGDKFKGLDDCWIRVCGSSFLVCVCVCVLLVFFFLI